MASTSTKSGTATVPSLRSPGLWVALLAGAVVAVYAVATGGKDSENANAPRPAGTVTFGEPGRNHVQGTVHYDHTPPAGGPHNPIWLNCGVYTQPVVDENAVHSLEHGAVWITYQPSLPAGQVAILRRTVQTHDGGGDRYVILSPYPGQPAPVMATAWGNQLSLQSASDPRVAGFIEHFREGPQDLERGAPCAGGVGKPVG
jgi:hypothetical protein